MKAYHVSGKRSRTVPSAIFEKSTDVLSLLILSFLSLALFAGGALLIPLSMIAAALLISGLVLIWSKRAVLVMSKILMIPGDSRKEFSGNIRKLFSSKTLALKMQALSLLYYAVCMLFSVLMLKSLSPDLDPLLALSLPVLALFGNLPITVSGLGARELIASLYFGSLGYAVSYGFSFSIVWFMVITLVPGLIGFLATIASRERNKTLSGVV